MTHEEAKERELAGKADLIVAKQRNGPTDDVKLTWRQSSLASRTGRSTVTTSSIPSMVGGRRL